MLICTYPIFLSWLVDLFCSKYCVLFPRKDTKEVVTAMVVRLVGHVIMKEYNVPIKCRVV